MPTDQELIRLKAVPGHLTTPIPREKEARAVEGSLYHLWWRCLRANSKYLDCCEVQGHNHPFAKTYANFGDVRIEWSQWWTQTGRKIFSERHDYPKVRAVKQSVALKQLKVKSDDFLILDIPMGLKRTTILEQINKLLDEYHPGRELDVWEQSTAKVKLQKSMLHDKTLPKLVEVAEILHKQPNITLYELADAAKLAEIHLGRSIQEELTPREERQRRELAASRYKEQAQALVSNAACGQFPSVGE